MKFLNNLDLQKNEILNFRVQNLASAPSNPAIGQHYFNTVDGTEYVYNGSGWVDALSQGAYIFEGGVTVTSDKHVKLTAATDTAMGGVIIGDNIDVNAGTISVKDATNAQKGLIQLATDAEAAAGTDTAKAVNAKQVKDVVDAAVADKIELADISADGPITYNNTTGKIGANVDSTATKDSTNLITSGAVEAGLAGKVDKETGKSLVSDTDIAQITTNKTNIATNAADIADIKDDIADINTALDDKLEAADLPTKLSDLTDDSETTPIKEAAKLTGLTATVAELNYVDGVTSNVQDQLDGKVDANAAITGATKCKITYDAKGLVTGGADLAAADIPDLNLAKITDVTATAAEVNKLAGLATTATELGYVNGVTSNIQDQLDDKLDAADLPTKISDLTDDTATTPIARATGDKDGNAIDTTYVKVEKIGVANGVASLDANGLVPAAQLPSFVDDVIDLVAVGTAPATCKAGDVYFNTTENKIHVATADNTWGVAEDAEAGKIYVNLENNMSYRWSGTTLVQIGADKLLGFNALLEGDGTTTTFNVDHNLGTRNVVFEIYEAVAPFEKVYVQVLHTSLTQLQVVFAQAPETGVNYNITVIAIG